MHKIVVKFLREHKRDLIAISAVVIVYLVMFLLGITCPIKYLTGISCPGCGMSRACIHALKLDFALAFQFHPLWIALPFALFFLVFFKVKAMKKSFYVTLAVSVCVMLAVYFIRIISGEGSVVVFSPKSGLIYRAVQALLALFN